MAHETHPGAIEAAEPHHLYELRGTAYDLVSLAEASPSIGLFQVSNEDDTTTTVFQPDYSPDVKELRVTPHVDGSLEFFVDYSNRHEKITITLPVFGADEDPRQDIEFLDNDGSLHVASAYFSDPGCTSMVAFIRRAVRVKTPAEVAMPDGVVAPNTAEGVAPPIPAPASHGEQRERLFDSLRRKVAGAVTSLFAFARN